MKKMRKGFTLVELLIVISIIGVLAASISMSAKDSTSKAKAAKIISDFRSIGAAVALYMIDSKDTLPTTTYFTNHSEDYIFGGKMGGYEVTSDDALGKKWYVEYKGTTDASVLEGLKAISEDVGLIGQKKMRIK